MSSSGQGKVAESEPSAEVRQAEPIDDQGLSLEELSSAYAELLSRGATPYDEPPDLPEGTVESPQVDPLAAFEPEPADVGCDLTPKSILEAILFVGNGMNQPLTSRRVAGLMRGVRPQEIDDLVRELNEGYRAESAAYEIASVEAGYVFRLRDEFAALRDSFFGRVREARLTQAAIDVLAIVAYRQPISREDIDQLRATPSGGILSQLVRRGLIRLQRDETKAQRYRTTDRFLQLFGLEGLSELPQSHDTMTEE